MKKLAIAAMLTAICGGSVISKPSLEVKASLIRGGSISFDFSNTADLNRFTFLTSFDKLPTFYDHAMHTYIYAEQKAILNDLKLDEYLIEADFGPSVYFGHIDTGFYLQASNARAGVDQINGWCLNIEHDELGTLWKLKLHRFQNDSWKGVVAEINDLPFWNSEWLHLSALVKDGWMTAYINGDYENPMMNYYIGEEAGLVGIRSFKCPSKVSNLKITSPSFELDVSALSKLIEECETLKEIDYTPATWANFAKAFQEAKLVKDNPENQLIVNDQIGSLKKARKDLLERKSFADLQKAIAEAEKINDESKYTQNSYKSLQKCIEMAKELKSDSSIEDISYMTMMLLYRLQQLIEYGGE